MSSRVLSGPWPTQPLTWFASVNGGASAFSVRGNTPQQAVAAAASRLYDEIRAEVYAVAQAHADDCRDCDVFELDTVSEAEVERRFAIETAALQLFTPQEWTERCHLEYRARLTGGAA
jgi:hypothetical protein